MSKAAMVIGLALVLAIPATALAGAWAVTEFDEALPTFIEGEEHTISFTVLQHGETPQWTEGAGLRFVSEKTGDEAFFPGIRSDQRGHFAATVILPAGGSWIMEVEQGVLPGYDLHFEPWPVGRVDVENSKAAAVAPAVAVQETAPPNTTLLSDVAATQESRPSVLWLTAVGTVVALLLLIGLRTISQRGDRPSVYKRDNPAMEPTWKTES